jgi:hypothetical protein
MGADVIRDVHRARIAISMHLKFVRDDAAMTSRRDRKRF